MQKYFYILIVVFLVVFSACKTQQNTHKDAKKTETIPNKTATRGNNTQLTDTTQKAISPKDSLLLDANVVDSLTNDSTKRVANDTIKSKRAQKSPFEEKVTHVANDSMVFDLTTKKLILYDSAQVNYQKIELKSAYIEIDMNNKELFARGELDSFDVAYGRPVFSDNGNAFDAESMTYNFGTKTGRIKSAVTKQGESYLHAAVARKDSNDVIYVKGAKFTTCTDPDHPHFYIYATKGKVIPEKLIVTGPANFRVADIPTPIWLPFGIFPTSKTKSSGIILPEYGELKNYGFFLKNLGYYFAINDYVDFTLFGDIYTSLSFGARGVLNYKKRYKGDGKITLGFTQLQYGDPKIAQDFRQDRSFTVQWQHNQDPKANPTVTFKASVNIQGGNYNKYNTNSVAGIVQNQFSSNISVSKIFYGTPLSLAVSFRHSQNTSTKRLDVTLPEVLFNVSRFAPFKRKVQVGGVKWYENIGMTYSFNFRNDMNTYDTLLVRQPLQELANLNNGIQQRIAINTSVKLLKYFTLAPSLDYTEKWNFRNLSKFYDPNQMQVVNDTVNGFFTTRQMNANINLTTIVYGMYTFKKGPVTAIRHVMTPRIVANFRPDLGDWIQGFYGPNGEFINWSPNQIGIYGSAPQGMSGTVGFSIDNNLEMKVRSKKDTITGIKKIPILEQLNINMNYDFAKDSLNLSNLNVVGRTSLFNNMLGLNFNFSFDPYAIQGDGPTARRINQLQVTTGKSLMRLTYAMLNLNFSLKGKSKRPNEQGRYTASQLAVLNDPFFYSQYVDFTVPYSLTIAYNIVYSRPIDVETWTHTINIAGDVNITKNWKVSANINYDIQGKRITTSTINIHRDLHCWEMRFTVIPFGIRQSYLFTIGVKPGMLQDLKLQRRSGYVNF